MTYELVPVDTREVATAHATLTDDHHHDHDLTIIWSTETVWCEPGDPSHFHQAWAADRIPELFDPTGYGDWFIVPSQCGSDGTMHSPASAIRRGHLHGAALAAVTQLVAAGVAADRDQWYDETKARLLRRIEEYLVLDTEDDREWYETGSDTEPGLYRDTPGVIAWCPDPWREGDIIEVVADLPDLPSCYCGETLRPGDVTCGDSWCNSAARADSEGLL